MFNITCTFPGIPPKQFTSQANKIIIGRSTPSQKADLDLAPDSTVSRRHARLVYDDNSYWLEDLGSKYGTWINSQRIDGRVPVDPNTNIQIGRTTLTLDFPDISPQTESDTSGEFKLHAAEGSLTSIVSAREDPSDLLINKKILQEASLVRRRLTAFYELGSALARVSSLQGVFNTVIDHLARAIPGAQRTALLLTEEERLSLKAYSPQQLRPSLSLNLAQQAINGEEGLIWRIDKTGNTDVFDSVLIHRTQSAMYAPLVWENEVVGVVLVDNFNSKDAFNDDDLRLLMAMANQAAMFVRNHTLQETLRHQQVVRSNLMRQFSPQVAERLEKMLTGGQHLQLGGEMADPVTILVSDIRGFTSLTANMSPSEIVMMLNELYSICTPIIFEYNGTVDKYVGDSILAVFGSPEPDPEQWQNAVWAAVEMQQAIYKLGLERRSGGLPYFQMGIGIHTGAVLQGFIGSEERMQYTVIGDAVNRATRYCNGAGPGEVIISQAVLHQVTDFVTAEERTVTTKHPETEPDLNAYVIKEIIQQVE